jgi:hypothetical protein
VKDRIKDIYGSETLVDQEWDLTLEMLTSRTANTKRERGNTLAKQQQGKALSLCQTCAKIRSLVSNVNI